MAPPIYLVVGNKKYPISQAVLAELEAALQSDDPNLTRPPTPGEAALQWARRQLTNQSALIPANTDWPIDAETDSWWPEINADSWINFGPSTKGDYYSIHATLLPDWNFGVKVPVAFTVPDPAAFEPGE